MNKITLKEAEYWSHFQLICVKLRIKGIRVSMKKIEEGMDLLEDEIQNMLDKFEKFGMDKTILDSPTKLAKKLVSLGFELPKTNKGQDSTAKEWLEENSEHKVISSILEYREANKIYNDFFLKILEMQQYTCPEARVEGAEYGMVYPEMNVFGAQTGRFSSSCPNIQQIPKRSKKWGALARGIFVPKEGTTWYSLDWSNQEGRLAVHYAKLLGSPGIDELVSAFKENPKLDMHQKVADIVGIQRDSAKTINLGLMYSMGQGKLCKKLGLPTSIEDTKYGKQVRAGKEGKKLLAQYNEYLPFINDLNTKCKNQMQKQGFIYTLLRRKSYNKAGKEYKALNRLIQGSAADQCLQVLRWADDNDLDIICLVHDEFNIQGTLDNAMILARLMEDGIKFEVPMKVTISVGDSWGTLEKL